MSRGKFITFEGGEGAGKSTQTRLLGAALEQRGLEVVITREPGGTSGAERIRELLLTNEGEGWGARSEALLFAAARSDHVERLIEPALTAGKWVICDRFLDSSMAYQGAGGGLDDGDILALHGFGSSGLLPDLTLLLEVSPSVAAQRLAARDGDNADRIGAKSSSYHASVAAAFRRFADQEPDRFARIDGDGDADAIHRAVMAAVMPMLGRAP
jgi:dTMP kinase